MKKGTIVLALAVCWLQSAEGQIYLSGPLSGVLEDTTYVVTGDITVEAGDSLVIEAGAELNFTVDTKFTVNGYLSAVGTTEDSIYLASVKCSKCK